MEEFALFIEFTGEILIAVSVVRVHSEILEERQIDSDVYKQIRFEHVMVTIGILLMAMSYIIQIFLM